MHKPMMLMVKLSTVIIVNVFGACDFGLMYIDVRMAVYGVRKFLTSGRSLHDFLVK